MTDDIVESLRRQDRDRYLSVLYAPANKRPALIALYAFNAEIASIRDRIHEPLPGEVRLQWWRDLLESGASEASAGHPLAAMLLDAISAHALPVKTFVDMIDARVFDLYNDPMPSRADLEGYCGETASALIQLAALILDAKAASAIADVAGHAGCAQAIAGLLRLLPLHRARGQCYVPADVLAVAGITLDAFLAARDRLACRRVIDAMVALARDHLAKANTARVPPMLRSAFLPIVLTGPYLDAIAKLGADAMEHSATINPIRKNWLMMRAAGDRRQ